MAGYRRFAAGAAVAGALGGIVMRAILRMTQSLRQDILADLARPHPYAAERMGFVFSRTFALSGGIQVALGYGYQSVPDDEYLRDPTVGARVGTLTTRRMLQHALTEHEGIWQVHQHGHRGAPVFSPTDVEWVQFLQAFHAVASDQIHGLLLLSNDAASTVAYDPVVGTEACRHAFVGYPALLGGAWSNERSV